MFLMFLPGKSVTSGHFVLHEVFPWSTVINIFDLWYISRIYYDMLKQEAVFFRSIPQDELTDKLLREHNFTNGHLEILAELFNAEAEVQMARGNKKECAEYSLKALVLFEFIDKEQKTYSYERIKRMEGLRERIKSIR